MEFWKTICSLAWPAIKAGAKAAWTFFANEARKLAWKKMSAIFGFA